MKDMCSASIVHTPASVPAGVAVLLVDDDPANLLALTGILQPLGARLVQAQSGTEALRRLLEDDFAVILLDVRMPDMTGFEAATLIRSRPRSRATPIIFLTGTERSADAIFEGYSSGAVDYLMKPVVPMMLRSKVEVFIELASARLALQHEVKERQAAAEALSQLNELLEQRNDELANANSELDAFCAAVSHDLRTPLSQMLGFAQLLELSAAERLKPAEQQHLQLIRTVGLSMNQMVTDFLNFARLGHTSLQSAEVDMDALVGQVIGELAEQWQKREVQWTLDPLPEARGDAHMLHQVMVNLVSNALKFSRNSQPPRIAISAQAVPGEVVYAITDNGVGFDASQSHRLFAAFSRLHEPNSFEGIGIGLSLVKRIVHKHGGRVWAEGVPGQGATFYFSIPTGEATLAA